MADNNYYSDGDDDENPEAAAMAEAMGFTGFGMQQRGANKKRKLPHPPSQTGANNAPLGKRRLPMNLPKPVVPSSSSGRGDGDGGDGNPEAIDLDGGDDGGGAEVYGGSAAGGEADVDVDEEDLVVNERAAALTVDDAQQQQQQHHSLPPRPQQQQQNHHHAAQGTPGKRGPGKSPWWWEGTWDPRLISRMIENPWDRLEKQRGLEARGAWPSATARGGGGGPAAAPRDNNDTEGEDVSSSSGPPGLVVPTIGEAVLAGLRQTKSDPIPFTTDTERLPGSGPADQKQV